jgi:hypothetical protein
VEGISPNWALVRTQLGHSNLFIILVYFWPCTMSDNNMVVGPNHQMRL